MFCLARVEYGAAACAKCASAGVMIPFAPGNLPARNAAHP
jgi:hypothetical protein